jgi:hypothetical protein
LIAHRYVLTAAHVLAVANPHTNILERQIDIFAANNRVHFSLPGGDQLVPIAGVSLHPDYSHRHPFVGLDLGSDIAVIELAADAPTAAPRYPIYTGSGDLPSPFFKIGYGLAGWGNNTVRAPDHLKRAGLNHYEVDETYWIEAYTALGYPGFPLLPPGTGLVYDFDNGSANNNALGPIIPFPFNSAHFGSDEVFPFEGDSGAPGFIWDAASLSYKVAGVTSFNTTGPADLRAGNNGSFGEIAIDTRVSAFQSYIQDVVAGEIPTLKARVLDDGGNWFADESGTFDHHALRIADSASGMPTKLEIQDGSHVGTGRPFPVVYSVELRGDSQLTMTGGELEGSSAAVLARNNSTLEIYGGEIQNPNPNGRVIEVGDQSSTQIHGGTIGGTGIGVTQYGNSSLTVTGGTITGEQSGVFIFGNKSFTITGGSIVGETTAGIAIGPETVATVMIHGGSISGGIHDLINNSPQSRIQIYGREESFTLPLGEVTAESGNVTGVFADGTPFDFSYFRGGGGGIIELVAAAAGIPGDYNSDGIVDAADYVVWRKNVGGPAGSLPNDTDGGIIGSPQYATWRVNFGRSTSAALSATHMSPVPEPASDALTAVAIVTLLAIVRRRCYGRKCEC